MSIYKTILLFTWLVLMIQSVQFYSFPQKYSNLQMWVTQGNAQKLLQKQKTISFSQTLNKNENPLIIVDDTKKYQTIDGFGFALTGGSAMLINKMNSSAKDAILKELFGQADGQLGISYLRLSMGSSDLDEQVFSYNDLPNGQTDINQTKFSIKNDKTHLIPVLKAILAINPSIKTMATPWSPPTWMKDNNKSVGGTLKLQYYDSYAKYFVKYIQAMKAQGITINAITPQNQPLYPGNNPSMLMIAEQERDFIKNNLGPSFTAANLSTKIVIYDHNLDRPDYPLTILKDVNASKFIDGSAFHMYAGNASVMGDIHKDYPSKNLYFTEQWTRSIGQFQEDMMWHTKNVIIGTMRYWSKIALQWNLANDPQYGPHTPGGCTQCKGALTINGSQVTRNVAYYIIGHASKFVPAGSVRIDSNNVSPIQTVAFLRKDGKKAMIILNEGDTEATINLQYKGQFSPIKIDRKSVMTVTW